MPAVQDALADAVLQSKPLLVRFLKGFDDSNHTRQAPGLPNHVAWCLGHLAHTMNRVAEHLDGGPLPETDFGARTGPGGAGRYDPESVAFASRPAPDPRGYPSMARCVEIFERAVDRMASAVRRATDADLDGEVPWGAGTTTKRALASRMVFHNGMHGGQITDLRRALGMGGVIG